MEWNKYKINIKYIFYLVTLILANIRNPTTKRNTGKTTPIRPKVLNQWNLKNKTTKQNIHHTKTQDIEFSPDSIKNTMNYNI